ncbi:MAG: hypothetical protein J5I92_15280 [Thiogranum sp.]|nr:hypothetical protein [Thiogranum sp.]
MIDWISNNKEWLFGGVGVAVVAFVSTALWRNVSVVCVASKLSRSCASYLPNFLLRRLFKPLSLETLVNIDLRPRGDSINMNLGELPAAKIWLQIINHSPFDIELANMTVELWCGAATVDLSRVESISIKAHSTNNDVLVKGALTGEQAEYCSRLTEGDYLGIRINASFKSPFASFSKDTGQMECLHVRTLNKREAIV